MQPMPTFRKRTYNRNQAKQNQQAAGDSQEDAAPFRAPSVPNRAKEQQPRHRRRTKDGGTHRRPSHRVETREVHQHRINQTAREKPVQPTGSKGGDRTGEFGDGRKRPARGDRFDQTLPPTRRPDRKQLHQTVAQHEHAGKHRQRRLRRGKPRRTSDDPEPTCQKHGKKDIRQGLSGLIGDVSPEQPART